MTVLLVLHLMQIVIDGAYKAPREVNFWFGLLLLFLIGGLSLSGYLLPWDQKGILVNQGGYKSGRNRAVRGGTASANAGGWHRLRTSHPDSVFCSACRSAARADDHACGRTRDAFSQARSQDEEATQKARWNVLARPDFLRRSRLSRRDGDGSHSDLLASRCSPLRSCRCRRTIPGTAGLVFPVSLSILKYFEGKALIIGGVIIPGIVALILFAMPLLANKWKWGHRFNLWFLWGGLVGFTYLTAVA